jgi:hypothetical protein
MAERANTTENVSCAGRHLSLLTDVTHFDMTRLLTIRDVGLTSVILDCTVRTAAPLERHKGIVRGLTIGTRRNEWGETDEAHPIEVVPDIGIRRDAAGCLGADV